MDLKSLPWYMQLGVFMFMGLVIFGLFYFFYYSDNATTIERMDAELQKLDQEISKAAQKKGQMKQMEEDINTKKKVLEDLKEVLPEQKETNQILSKVQAIISSARLRIMNWTSQKERKKPIYNEIPVSITVDGNYHNLAIFFGQLARLKKIFTVDNLNITPLAQTSSTYSIHASFIATTYTYTDKGGK